MKMPIISFCAFLAKEIIFKNTTDNTEKKDLLKPILGP